MASRFSLQRRTGRAIRTFLGVLFAVAITFSGSAWAGGAGNTVRVLYPDGLADIMQHDIAPAFEQATGNRFAGDHAPSIKLAEEIQQKARTADVLICANPEINLQLMGLPQGDWIDWYAVFMQAPLVVGYDPESRFARALKSKPWYQVAAEPGFRLGLTDPNEDPKGGLTVKALQRAVQSHDLHGKEKSLAANSRIVPEQDLNHRLQSHQLDAAFFYQPEAATAGIPSVPVNLGDISTTYTITILNRAAHPGAASAFVAFLLSEKGKKILEKNDALTIMPAPAVFGSLGDVPDELKSILSNQ